VRAARGERGEEGWPACLSRLSQRVRSPPENRLSADHWRQKDSRPRPSLWLPPPGPSRLPPRTTWTPPLLSRCRGCESGGYSGGSKPSSQRGGEGDPPCQSEQAVACSSSRLRTASTAIGQTSTAIGAAATRASCLLGPTSTQPSVEAGSSRTTLKPALLSKAYLGPLRLCLLLSEAYPGTGEP